jgi:hypothetical protein
MYDEPFAGAEQLVRDDQGSDRVIGATASGVANDMRVAFGKSRIFRGIEPRVHAGEDSELSSWRQGELPFLSKLADIDLIGRDDLVDDFRHHASPV